MTGRTLDWQFNWLRFHAALLPGAVLLSILLQVNFLFPLISGISFLAYFYLAYQRVERHQLLTRANGITLLRLFLLFLLPIWSGNPIFLFGTGLFLLRVDGYIVRRFKEASPVAIYSAARCVLADQRRSQKVAHRRVPPEVIPVPGSNPPTEEKCLQRRGIRPEWRPAFF